MDKVIQVHHLVEEAIEDSVAGDATGKNALAKLKTATAKVTIPERIVMDARRTSGGETEAKEDETVVESMEIAEDEELGPDQDQVVGEETIVERLPKQEVDENDTIG